MHDEKTNSSSDGRARGAGPSESGGQIIELPWHRKARQCLEFSQRPLLLVGKPGSGKSTFAVHAAMEATGRRPELIFGSPQTEERHIWAEREFDRKGTRWVDGPVPRSLKNGAWLLVEEVNQIPPEVVGQFLQFRRDPHQEHMVQNLANGEWLRVPPDWRVIFTANPQALDCYSASRSGPLRALIDGCLVLEVPPMNTVTIRRLMVAEFCNELSGPMAEYLDRALQVWEGLNSMASDESQSESPWLSYRAVAELLRLALAGMDWNDAVEVSCVGKYVTDRDIFDAAKLRLQLSEQLCGLHGRSE